MVTSQNSNPTKKDIEAIYPLSAMQQGMLFQSLYNPESKVYLSQLQISLEGNLDINAFQLSWQKVVDRHGIFRTCFAWKKTKQPLQIVRKNVDLPWFNYDWQQYSAGEQAFKLTELLKSDQDAYFQLDQVPLTRCHLIRLDKEKYEFIITGHHILLDGWSTAIVMDEACKFYAGIINNQTVNLPSPRPYQDYITWVLKQDQTQAEKFWRKNLQGFTSPTPLVVNKPLNNQVKLSKNYVNQKIYLASEITNNLRILAQENRLTFATLIQGVWALLLHNYTGELDIVFGGTVSGRPSSFAGIQTMVGIFLNTLPVRIKIDPEIELLDWFKQLQDEYLEREQYSYSSLIDIQKWSEIPPPQSVFESFLVFENLPFTEQEPDQMGGLKMGELQDHGNADYPLTVIVTPTQNLSIKIIYPREEFEDETITRMLGHFENLLTEIALNYQRKIKELSILTESERQLLLVEWNQTIPENPLQHCVHQLFEQQVIKTPEAIAVVFQEEKLTYQQLNESANQLAHYLQKIGVNSETLIGICLERSLKMAIAILAVLKVGGVCVPLDPNYPQERLNYILKDTQIKILLTQKNCQSVLNGELIPHSILLDEKWSEITLEHKQNLDNKVTLENLAYLVYSSGSTGVPKGIMIVHQSLTNLIEHHQAKMSSERNFLQFASFNFDVSYHEIFAAWCLGGTLFIATEESRLDLPKLTNLLANNPIHKAILPVTLLQQLIETYSEESHLFINLREIISAGEQLQITQPMIDLFKQLKNCKLYNFYGPTEADLVTSYAFDQNPENWSKYIPIGKPAVNVKVYILNSNLQPVPIGITGELYVTGGGLARGYFNNPELTQEKFISNPFKANSFLYKTGDLARYLPNGDIEYVGRIDDIVKVRGYRIELGEVEAILNQYPQIAQAVATVQGENAREKYLAAYYIPRHNEIVNLLELRSFLEKWLPDYMIPSTFVEMTSFILSPNGKVDRQKLPIPEKNSLLSTQNYLPPRNAIEEVMTEIWAEILEVEKVGIEDDFFMLGGHSLKAIQLISKIRQTLEIEISVRQLFTNPKISQLVTVMGEIVGGEELLNEIALTFQEISKLSPEEIKALLAQN